MKRIKEEYNRLLKVKLFQQGTNQWRILPVEKRDGTAIRRKDITFRGTDEKLKLLLRRLKAKDAATDPPSAKNRTYQQMIDTARDKSDPYIWIWLTIWNNYKDGKKIVNYESAKYRDGDSITVPHKGRLVTGKVVRYDPGNSYTGETPFYVVDVGEYESIKVPIHRVHEKYITLEKDLLIPGTTTLLEKGDTIEIIQERVEPYETYHNSYTRAIDEVIAWLLKQSLKMSEDDIWSYISVGPKKPNEGQTNRFDILLYWSNVHDELIPAKKMVHFQIYGMSNSYELNMYLSPAKIKDYPPEHRDNL